MIPLTHPRYESLRIREMLAAGFTAGAVAVEGLLAHGRGEAFDYMLGERTIGAAGKASKAAAAALLLSERPVISVNGNLAALCAADTARLADVADCKLEVNLFYDDVRRRRVIAGMLQRSGASEVLGVAEDLAELPGIESPRRLVSPTGILAADTVLVPLEDGDRAGALVAADKGVITIDLNPASRTARTAHVTIVDNVVRAVPRLVEDCLRMALYDEDALRQVMRSFNNADNLAECARHMARNFGGGRPA